MYPEPTRASIVLHYHPFTRSTNVLTMLEEAGCDYALQFVDLSKDDHKSEDATSINRMGKVPILVDITDAQIDARGLGK
ncbi:MAG: hypothetical protein V3V08_18770 [Nannocystaceae bacterium]